MDLHRINYSELNARQKEIYNFQKLAAILADYGFNCIKMSDDWQGADFLADHMNGGQTLRVQLKARLTISRKYEGRNLYVGFPAAGNWCLAPHDELVEIVGKTTKWLDTKSWREDGLYSSGNPSLELLHKLRPFIVSEASESAAAQPSTIAQPLPTTPATTGTREARDSSTGVEPHKVKYVGIDKRKLGQGWHLDISVNGMRYLVPHDELVKIAGEVTPWLDSPSWRERGRYSTTRPSRALTNRLRKFAIT